MDGQYTVGAQVIEGMDFVDNITRGEPPQNPDKIIKMEIINKIKMFVADLHNDLVQRAMIGEDVSKLNKLWTH